MLGCEHRPDGWMSGPQATLMESASDSLATSMQVSVEVILQGSGTAMLLLFLLHTKGADCSPASVVTVLRPLHVCTGLSNNLPQSASPDHLHSSSLEQHTFHTLFIDY